MIIHVFRYVKMASNRNEPCAAGLSRLQDPGRHSARPSPTLAVPVRIAYAGPAKQIDKHRREQVKLNV